MIPFALSRPGRCVLAAYNIQGQTARALVDGADSAGAHSVRWDGRDDRNRAAGAGVYRENGLALEESGTRDFTVLRVETDGGVKFVSIPGGRGYMSGTDDGTLDKHTANYFMGPGHPADVKIYPPNPFGLSDIVWEWCLDSADKYTAGSVTDPAGWMIGTSANLRGGSDKPNREDSFREAARRCYPPAALEGGNGHFGFRIKSRVPQEGIPSEPLSHDSRIEKDAVGCIRRRFNTVYLLRQGDRRRSRLGILRSISPRYFSG